MPGTCEHTTIDHDQRDEDHQDEKVILGVDTHADVHVAAVINVLGILLGTQAFPATAASYNEL